MRTVLGNFIIISLLLLSACGNESPDNKVSENPEEKPEIAFKSLEHDFGNIEEGVKTGTIFSFTNQGRSNLVIASATTSCGCTVPKFSNKPVAPGESGTVEVVFDSSGREGKQTKTITIRSNASKPVIVLKITANIVTK